jgi:hypothetical protein
MSADHGRGAPIGGDQGCGAPAERQGAGAVLVVRPDHFASNAETLDSNRFQRPGAASAEIRAAAHAELDGLARRLVDAGIDVHTFPGRPVPPASPDEVFPNNWISTHADGTLVVYPLMAPSRRLERRAEIVDGLRTQFEVRRFVDLSALEESEAFLEGTGSLVLDRPGRVAFACLSPRTSEAGLQAFAKELVYRVHAFDARDAGGRPIYHTNVMLSIGSRFAVVCGESVQDLGARRDLFEALEASGREIVDIGFDEMASFGANLLELTGRMGPVIALSMRALTALDPRRRRALERHAELVAAEVGTIETYGGGSVRCMLAEIHLERRAGT